MALSRYSWLGQKHNVLHTASWCVVSLRSTPGDVVAPLRATSTPWKTPSKPEPKRFTYDKVFGPDTTQPELYESIRPTVMSVLDGFNATVLSYGYVVVPAWQRFDTIH